MKPLTDLTPIDEDPKVIAARDKIKECRIELEEARAAYSQLALPKNKERFYEAEQAMKTAEEALTKARAEAAAERAPILTAKFREAVRTRHEIACQVVPRNEAVYALKEEADRVLGHMQTVIPNLRWPEFREGDGSKLNFWVKYCEKGGWL